MVQKSPDYQFSALTGGEKPDIFQFRRLATLAGGTTCCIVDQKPYEEKIGAAFALKGKVLQYGYGVDTFAEQILIILWYQSSGAIQFDKHGKRAISGRYSSYEASPSRPGLSEYQIMGRARSIKEAQRDFERLLREHRHRFRKKTWVFKDNESYQDLFPDIDALKRKTERLQKMLEG